MKSSEIGCASPSTYPAKSSAGQPSLSSACLRLPRSEACTTTVSSSIRRAEHPGDLLGPQHLLEHRPVGADQHQPVGRVLLQPQPAVAGHRLGDVDQQRVRDGVAAVLQQRVDDLLGVVAGGPRVPEPERRQPVGVDVLGRALELGERRDRLAAVGGALVVDLEQQRLVGLDDQGPSSSGAAHAVGRRPSAGRGRPRRWRARSSGRSSSAGTGWARCRRRRWCRATPSQTPSRWGRGRRPGWPARAATRRPAARRPTGPWSATCMCRPCSVVVGDPRRDRVPHHQLVDPVDHARAVVGGRGLEDRPQLALELAQQHAVAVGALRDQPLPVGEVAPAARHVGDLGVEQPGRPLGVPDEVHRRVYGLASAPGRISPDS